MAAELTDLLGRSPDGLNYAEQKRIAGKWIALELYTPETLPLRKIDAIGTTAGECIQVLKVRGLDPKAYEFFMMPSIR